MNKTTRILVVEDNPSILDIFSEILRNAGYEVCRATTGQKGLDLARSEQPAVVLLDVRLPDLSGIEVCKQIKADPAMRDVFVVFCSGEAVSAADKVGGLDTGADDYLTKPVHPAELLARIRTLVRLRDNIVALRVSERRFRQLAENIREVFWITNVAKDEMIYVSPAYEEIWGRTCESLYASPGNWIETLHPDDRKRIFQAVLTKQVSGQYDEVYRIVRPDGSIRWVQDRAFPVRNDAGKVYRIVGIAEDITKRIQAETNYRSIFENAMEGIFRTTPQGRYLSANPAAARMLGYDSPEELIGLVTDLGQKLCVNPESRVALKHQLEKDGYVRGFENQIYRKDGSKIWVSINARVVRDASGKALYFEGTHQDITKRRVAEEALRESEASKSAITRAALDAIITFDQRGRVKDVNPAAEKIFDYPRARMIGEELAAVILAPSSREWFQRGLRESFSDEGGTFFGDRVETVAQRADGSEFPVEFVVTRIEVEGPLMFTAFIHDISQRRQAEEQIQLMADAVQSTQELISIADSENRFTFVNQAFLAAYGYGKAEILGRKLDFICSPNNPRGLVEEVFKKTIAGGWKGEILKLRKDGTEFPVSLSTTQIKNGAGKILGLIGVARDIAERKHAERQSTAFSQLGHRLNAATTPEQAASIILEIAAELFGWDAGFVNLYSQTENKILPVLMVDTVDGRRVSCQPSRLTRDPTPLMQLILKKGARLIHPGRDSAEKVELVRFGNSNRHSACMMYVPIRSSNVVVGILSIQSYTSGVYSKEDLHILQTLADHCGDALRRIEVAEKLREAEMKYRGIFENATEGIFQTTPDGHYRSANPALARILGCQTPEELISNVTAIERQTYVRPERRSELKQLLKLHGAVQGFEAERYRKDGQKVWTSLNGHVVRDVSGNILYYEGTDQDITKRKQAEAVLRESEERFRALFESAPIGIALHNGDGHYIHTNRAYQEMLGYSHEELKRLGVKRITRSDDLAEEQRLFNELGAGNRNFYQREKRYLGKNGREVWVESSVSAVRDSQGCLCYIISMVEDINARKQAEEELRLLPQRIIEAQETERQRVARELHDGVNQIIASAKMRLLKVQDNLAALNPAAREILSRCGHLLNQALEENRRIAHNLRPSDLDELGLAAACRNYCKEMQSRASIRMKSSIRGLNQRLPPHLELNLFRILQEALNNVEKHAHAKNVLVQIARRNNHLTLKIQDDGRGFVSTASKERRKKRRGIGLTNMRERAAFLGGTFETQSVPDQGTTVMVRLPWPKSASPTAS